MPPPIRVQINNVMDTLNQGLSVRIGKVAFAGFQAIVTASPVDTGTFKGNWQPSINDRITTPLNTTDKGGASTINKARVLFANYEIGTGSKANKIVMSNNLNYAVPLNQGHSGQAASGFVQKGLRAGLDAVNAGGKVI